MPTMITSTTARWVSPNHLPYPRPCNPKEGGSTPGPTLQPPPGMRLIRNASNDRVLDAMCLALSGTASLDVASPSLCLFAFAELRPLLKKLSSCRMVPQPGKGSHLNLLGSEAGCALRSRLLAGAVARQCNPLFASLRLDGHPTTASMPRTKAGTPPATPTSPSSCQAAQPTHSAQRRQHAVGLGLPTENAFPVPSSSHASELPGRHHSTGERS